MYIAQLFANRFAMDEIKESMLFDTFLDARNAYKNRYDWLWCSMNENGLFDWHLNSAYDYQVAQTTDGVQIHTDSSKCKMTPTQLYPGQIMEVSFSIAYMEGRKERGHDMKTIEKMRSEIVEALQKRVNENCEKQKVELEEYKSTINQLLDDNKVIVTPKTGKPFAKRLSFQFTKDMKGIRFECAYRNDAKSSKDRDVEDVINRLYLGGCDDVLIHVSGVDQLDKLVNYLCDVAIPAFKRDPHHSFVKPWNDIILP